MRKTLLLSVAIVAILFSSCGNNKDSLSGAGATFPAPFYNIVFKEFAKSGTNVTYGAIGSGGGIRSLQDKTVDFGATDVYLSNEDLKEMPGDIVHIPTAIGGVVLSYNLKEISGLKLTAEVISDIYLGKIKNWNDQKLKDLNPELNLPDKAIIPVYRSDGSGTTSVFSEYMSKVNEAWSKDLGEGKSLNFPTGIAAKGNPGVAGIIVETDGAIGYIGSEYALALNMPTALLQNKAGNFIEANNKSISISAEIEMPNDTRISITNSPDPNAYPISTFTWLITYKEQNYNDRPKERAIALTNLLNYIISEEGQEIANKTHYAPLSATAIEKTKALINSMTYNGEAIATNN
ncbi:phosphate ABC transporter substrate-binding protein PstS [Dysgonomonas sp. Marseille-P4361]|uniref:phosphate ABC transporter substrate-binding protein PstS n=1 Tax=Dysgonomonas sp. Marseille-P4361 TaxID=2161820 RepID=UPI000D5548EA|nr:phosphate ABC transporter substrate-binding protein PstS [Dysgonomonas sp. Marseille-P4361]